MSIPDPATDKPRILPPIGMLVALLALTPLLALNWPVHPGDTVFWAGAAILAAGLGLNLWAAGLFRRKQTGLVPFTPATALVRTGPFRITRNPMYLGMVLIVTGAALMTGVLWNLVVPAVFALWVHFTYIRREERFMEAAFGQDYVEYKRTTARWLGPI